ncbi:uncharacterized protein [Euwallacea similis]|uniref:uncharacterized protein n=1 Tax=Euwallacea similis TaxID=1736056 RepID=UPI00344E057C
MTRPWDKRRMTISKFSNRPPFDRKKPRDRENIAEKIRCYPVENCRNCCKKRAESAVKERNFMSKSLPFDAPILGSADKLCPGGALAIPKVLEQFRKIHISDPTMNKYVSIQTLYRNTKAHKLGKNIPKHKLMASLFANWDSDAPKEGSSYLEKPKDKKSKRVFDGGEVISSDVWQAGTYHTSDKKTSTTGLLWPLRIREVLHYPSKDWADEKSTLSGRCKAGLNITKELLKNAKFVSEGFLETVLTKDAPPKRRTSPGKSAAHTRTRRSRQKTFVQAQVEKLNKTRKGPVVAQSAKTQEPKHEANNCYIGMMNKIRHNCLQFQSSTINLQPGFESANSWSDPSETVLIPREMKFPKETKTAVNQRLSEQNKSKILWFNVKKHEACRPRPPANNPETRKGGYNDGWTDEVHRNVQLEGFMKKKRPANIKQNSKFHIPCKKNLLCDKGDQHLESCSAHSNNKVVY